jgi:hypothetical protein
LLIGIIAGKVFIAYSIAIKWNINMEAFGDKCKYLQITGEEECLEINGVEIRLKGILFDVNA